MGLNAFFCNFAVTLPKKFIMSTSDNKRLAKNTGFLYIRLLFNLTVTLYTSRVVMKELGASDFGIYGVVGGIVTLFAFLTNSMTSAIGRFLTVDLAKGQLDRLRKVFSTSINIQLVLSFAVLLIIETVGVWFLNNKMVIAPERLVAANWVLQCAGVTFLLNMVSIPYNAAIIAHEKMDAFAYISILETSLKLVVAFLLAIKIYDSLIMYAVLTMICAVIIRFVYAGYCNRHFDECKYEFIFDKVIFKDIFAFSGWNFIGSIAAALRQQGVNVLMNLFFGTIVNAAQGLATQVLSSVQQFGQNFMTALNPQIIKSYATDDLARTRMLVMTGARLSFYLLLALSTPVIVTAPDLMRIWLTTVPGPTVLFVRLSLIIGMSDILSHSMLIANHATGKVKKYQLVVGGLQLSIFPIVYIAYKLGASAASSYYICLIISQISLFARIILVRKNLEMGFMEYINNVYWRVLVVGIITFLPIYYLYSWLPHNIWGILILGVVSVCWSLAIAATLGCTSAERTTLGNYLYKFMNKTR